MESNLPAGILELACIVGDCLLKIFNFSNYFWVGGATLLCPLYLKHVEAAAHRRYFLSEKADSFGARGGINCRGIFWLENLLPPSAFD